MSSLSNAVGQLRESLVALRKSETWNQIVAPRDGVFARFGPLFQFSHIPSLQEDEFRPFFYFEHNHHWTGLYRQINRLCADMPRLRQVLAVLVDESRPIDERLDECGSTITGLGKGIMTAILTVAYPDRYGVWNNVSEAGLLKAGVWPEFERGTSLGTKYVRINKILTELKDALGVDFWTLDAIWWQFGEQLEPSGPSSEFPDFPRPIQAKDVQRFGLERHLHDFLRDNWNALELSKDWVIYTEPGAPDAGYEYTCAVGRIDLLARHRIFGHWMVIELKREDTSDVVVGQVLRYMGWVQHHLAERNEEVRGLIIARSGDTTLQYAVAAVPNVTFMTYSVEFQLHQTPLLLDRQFHPPFLGLASSAADSATMASANPLDYAPAAHPKRNWRYRIGMAILFAGVGVLLSGPLPPRQWVVWARWPWTVGMTQREIFIVRHSVWSASTQPAELTEDEATVRSTIRSPLPFSKDSRPFFPKIENDGLPIRFLGHDPRPLVMNRTVLCAPFFSILGVVMVVLTLRVGWVIWQKGGRSDAADAG